MAELNFFGELSLKFGSQRCIIFSYKNVNTKLVELAIYNLQLMNDLNCTDATALWHFYIFLTDSVAFCWWW